MKINLYLIIFICLLTSCGKKPTMAEVSQRADKKWVIDEYTIYKTKKIGPAGPHFYEYEIFKGKTYLRSQPTGIDTCLMTFRERNDYYVNFDLCHLIKSIVESPGKLELDRDNIDSIVIRPSDNITLKLREEYDPNRSSFDTIIEPNFDSTVTRNLSAKQIKSFAKTWNDAREEFYVNKTGNVNDYLILVYSNSKVRTFITFNYHIMECPDTPGIIWCYTIMGSDKKYFDNLWDKAE